MSEATARARGLEALRSAAWLTPERARAWCLVLAILTATAATAWVCLSRGGLDLLGKPLGTDFVSFWAASRLALDGQAALAYDPAAHAAAQRALFPDERAGYFAFFYPPTFLVLCLPLAALPYLAALAAWLAAGFAALFACLRRVLPQGWAVLPIAAFPGVLVNAGHGQNGFLSGACLGGCMVLMQRRPFLAGACLGALAFKPHLLLAAPVALLAARRWTVAAGAATSALGLAAVSWLVLGEAAWGGFLRSSQLARATLEQGLVDHGKMQSVFAAVRLLHGEVWLAYAAQAVAGIAACALLARTAAVRPGAQAEGALLVAATLACTPFLLDYDLVCLALPIAWVAAEAQRTGWRPWEKGVLLAAYALPLASRPLAVLGGVPIAPVVLAALLLVVARRASQPRPSNPEISQASRGARMHASKATWAACIIATFALAALLHATGTEVQRGSVTIMTAIVLVLTCLHYVYARMRPDPLIAAATGGLATLLWAGLVAGMVALAGLRTGAALIDVDLAYADALLGADTQELVAWTARHPLIGRLLNAAYLSTVPAVFITAMFLACKHRPKRMWELCLSFAALGILCAFSSALMPADGAFIHYGVSPDILSELPSNAGVFHMQVVEAYRSGTRTMVDVFQLEGVATFPSFHTAMAVMTAYAVRSMGGLTVVAAIWCGLVVASTVPIGGHYVIDLIAGIVVWAGFAWLIRFLGWPQTSDATD